MIYQLPQKLNYFIWQFVNVPGMRTNINHAQLLHVGG